MLPIKILFVVIIISSISGFHTHYEGSGKTHASCDMGMTYFSNTGFTYISSMKVLDGEEKLIFI